MRLFRRFDHRGVPIGPLLGRLGLFQARFGGWQVQETYETMARNASKKAFWVGLLLAAGSYRHLELRPGGKGEAGGDPELGGGA